MIKKLVLMRHGQTLFNLRGKFQGVVDSPLTPLGIQQAKTVKPFLDDLPFRFDHAYSSSSERACDTLEIVTNLPYIRLKGLKEWNFGILEGEPEYLHPPFDQYDEYFSTHDGEGRMEVFNRINSTLCSIMEKEDHCNVIAASHGLAMREFVTYWTKDNPSLVPSRFANCIIFIFDYDTETKTFTLIDVHNPFA
ncbi:MAG: histidine phosphatase family protein [Bacillota bacterium]|uniref:histidine phosphatase family protein n=1 Tax=Allobaculum stercoricanis TaxID=174709 RepID=UPI0023F17D73|nr:histidine phosphatase family protein [Allobaculum stercoricanis]MDO5347957.1 histidine phosphatase family protein [Bacillota bacterium]